MGTLARILYKHRLIALVAVFTIVLTTAQFGFADTTRDPDSDDGTDDPDTDICLISKIQL